MHPILRYLLGYKLPGMASKRPRISLDETKAKKKDMARFDTPFARDYGLTLEALAARYEAGLRAEILQELKPKRKKPVAKVVNNFQGEL